MPHSLSVVVPAFSLVSLLGFSELFLFFCEQIKQGVPLDFILLLSQTLLKMLNIQESNPLIHSSHSSRSGFPVYLHTNIAQSDLQVSRQNSVAHRVAAVRSFPNRLRLIPPA
ncbi:hypothetical protein [Mesorhizobium sp. Root102]|uniref:hypothetical protein n=1 Tax=Mesorhizobium sp. Root102 TaxID=1736422 RepID=UPI0012E33A2C|nr:hypothetical protein [Mesorhizobium sp. Root102]